MGYSIWELLAAFAWGPCAIILLILTVRAPYCLWIWFDMKAEQFRAFKKDATNHLNRR